jgi:dipeptidyl-peptidase 4
VSGSMADSFPRQQARTRRFTLGLPRTFTVAPDGRRVLFLRSPGGADPKTMLWELDVAEGSERLVVDPEALGGSPGEETAEERARRERRREQAGGIVAYSTDRAVSVAAFVVAGELWLVDLSSGVPRRLEVTGPVFDARIDPTGTRVAWCCGPDLRVASLDGTGETVLAAAEGADVAWGQAEFVAAEEMDRDQGYWWAPDGSGLLAARVDVGPVRRWWIADPAYPDREPVAQRYPAAGTPDADVTLWWLGVDGTRKELAWDRDAYPYVPAVRWGSEGAPLLVVERRDHKACRVLAVDVAAGETAHQAGMEDPAFVEWPDGVPARLPGGGLLWAAAHEDTVALTVDGEVVTPAGLQVRAVVSAGEDVIFTGSYDPLTVDLWRWTPSGLTRLVTGGVVRAAVVAGGTAVTAIGDMDGLAVAAWPVEAPADEARSRPIASLAEDPLVTPDVRLLDLGPTRLRTGVLLPSQHRPGDTWPVLMLPYGGPGAQMVLADRRFWLDAQWRADQGWAVVVADGRGTPGRGPAWTREIYLDFATGVLEDQVTALHAAAEAVEGLDLDRVAIYGWSFGGYLSALAVLRRPDVFHAAVAGAPVTDWRLYDTYYTEKFLGHPDDDPGVYDRSSLLDDAPNLERPLLLIHGLVDDNVFVAHTLRLSQRLLAAGRPHAVIPLSSMTHMASGEEVAQHLASLQMGFLADAVAGR